MSFRLLVQAGSVALILAVPGGFSLEAESVKVVESPAGFTHPGILHSREDLHRIHDMVQAGYQPWARGFETLRSVPQSSLSYIVQGPFKNVAYENGQYEFRRDASAAYNLAIMWICTGDDRYAAKSMGIIRDWAREMESFDRGDHLTAGMGVSKFAAAAEIFRYTKGSGWTDGDTAQFRQFLERIKPAVDKPDLFMNQGGYALMGMLAIAVFTDDTAFYKKTIDRATVGDGKDPQKDPALSKTVWPSGQVVEMGRDQTHPQGGLGTLACIAQTAWIQGPKITGVDLFAAYDQRLLKGYEYLAAHNLGYDSEYKPVEENGKKGFYPGFSPNDLGKFTPIFELVYQHYKFVKKVSPDSLKYIAEVRDYLMPEGFSEDFPGFGTLLFTRMENKEPGQPLGPPKARKEDGMGNSPSGRFLAANFNFTRGVGREYYTDIWGRTELVASNIQADDYARYDDIDFGTTPVDTFIARAGSASPAGCKIDIILDSLESEPVGVLQVADTGWWSTYETFFTKLKRPVSGKHTLFLKFYGGNHVYKFECNLHWFKFGNEALAKAELQADEGQARFPWMAGNHYAAAVIGTAKRGKSGDGISFAEVKADGTTLSFPSVEFSSGAETISATLAGGEGARLEIRAGDRKSKPFAILEIPKSAEVKSWRTLACAIPASESKLKGHQMLFLTFVGEGKPLRLSRFQLDPPQNQTQ